MRSHYRTGRTNDQKPARPDNLQIGFSQNGTKPKEQLAHPAPPDPERDRRIHGHEVASHWYRSKHRHARVTVKSVLLLALSGFPVFLPARLSDNYSRMIVGGFVIALIIVIFKYVRPIIDRQLENSTEDEIKGDYHFGKFLHQSGVEPSTEPTEKKRAEADQLRHAHRKVGGAFTLVLVVYVLFNSGIAASTYQLINTWFITQPKAVAQSTSESMALAFAVAVGSSLTQELKAKCQNSPPSFSDHGRSRAITCDQR